MFNLKDEIDQWGPIDSNILYPSFWYRPTAHLMYKKWGVGWSDMIVFCSNDKITVFWDTKELERQGVKAIKRWLLKPANFAKLRKVYERTRNLLGDLAERIEALPLNKITKHHAKQWYDLEMEFWNDATVFEIINYAAPNFLRSLISKYVSASEVDRVLEALLAPERPSFHKESEIALWRTVAQRADFERYAQKWFWVDNSYLESKKISGKQFHARVRKLSPGQALKKVKDAEKYYQMVVANKQRLAKRYHLSKDIMREVKLLSRSLIIQDERKAMYWKALSALDKLCRVAAKKFKLPFEEILLYSAEEWRDLFLKGRKLSPSEIKNRKIMTVFETTRTRIKLYSGKATQKTVRTFLQSGKKQKSDVLAGIGVSRGRVRGRVRILLSPRFIKKLKQGEILVAPMTSPDFVVAMRKSKAVITDVGGLMSHAAVVSRELGIPCIVGTKVATKVLRDGDLVEVDAERGIVKKI